MCSSLALLLFSLVLLVSTFLELETRFPCMTFLLTIGFKLPFAIVLMVGFKMIFYWSLTLIVMRFGWRMLMFKIIGTLTPLLQKLVGVLDYEFVWFSKKNTHTYSICRENMMSWRRSFLRRELHWRLSIRNFMNHFIRRYVGSFWTLMFHYFISELSILWRFLFHESQFIDMHISSSVAWMIIWAFLFILMLSYS